ncbi:MAG TPA: ATP-binding protein [Bacteroidia bacterium]|nr:ATP-binding protein [Sphingobacteriales bacterium]HPD65809.1 ATP-binding protein [Bacteroidia bacterium]HRS59755.1 ATP-binding protein [Bacteroidia bacterium]HRU69222.1 ATP-binding protein [Bacteroidia bacterium]
MEKIYVRDELSEIYRSLNSYPVVGIIGPRQCGKTTLAKIISNDFEKTCLYLDLEFPDDYSKLENPVIFLNQHRNKCVIIDEIQYKPDLFPIIRSLVDQDRIPARFILLGSASPSLIKGSSESLAGRISYHELTPFKFAEIEAEFELNNHWLKGGFPHSFLAKSETESYKWRANFLRTYCERDLPQIGINQNPSVIYSLLQILASFHGNVLNSENLSRSTGLNKNSINKYLDFLESAFLIRKLMGFHLNIKKRIVKSPKIYIRDSGLFHSLLRIKNIEELTGNHYNGASWEGYIIEQVISHLKDDYDFYFYRTHQGAECDLVLVKGDKAEIGIEIKFSTGPKLSQGFYNAIEDLRTKRNYVVSLVSEPYFIKENVEIVNLPILLKRLKQV